MRQRKVRNLDEKLEKLSKYTVSAPEMLRGKWKVFFGNDNPVYLEIGCGKGKFAACQAELHSGRNYVAVEGQDSVAVRAMEKAEALCRGSGRKNLIVICKFVNDIGEMFEEGELAGIYLNFSDPWPKDRHRKRRLTYRDRLRSYMRALTDGGFIEIKTDNDALFEFTLEEIAACGYTPAAYAEDLHRVACAEEAGNKNIEEASSVTTEYEDKFKAIGRPIHYLRIEKEGA